MSKKSYEFLFSSVTKKIKNKKIKTILKNSI